MSNKTADWRYLFIAYFSRSVCPGFIFLNSGSAIIACVLLIPAFSSGPAAGQLS